MNEVREIIEFHVHIILTDVNNFFFNFINKFIRRHPTYNAYLMVNKRCVESAKANNY